MIEILVATLMLYVVYFVGQLVWIILWNVHEDHYFFGFNPRFFTFQIAGVKISVGLFIPLPFLSRVYSIQDGEKTRARSSWEFFEVPLIKRFLSAFGGVLALLVVGILVNIGVTYHSVDRYISKETVNEHGIHPSPTAQALGFKNGDKILTVNGKDFSAFNDIMGGILEVHDSTTFDVGRNGKVINMAFHTNSVLEEINSTGELLFNVLLPIEIGELFSGSNAENAGLMQGDKIIGVNGHEIRFRHQLDSLIKIKTSNDTLALDVQRQNDVLKITVPLNEEGRMGFYYAPLKYSTKQHSFVESIGLGTTRSFSIVSTQIKGFNRMFAGDLQPTRTLNGPIGIAQAYHNQGIFSMRFWRILGLLLMVSFFWNFLPLPKAAIWQSIPLIYEYFTRSPFSHKYYTVLKKLSYGLFFLFMIFVLVSDLVKLFIHSL